MLCAISNKLVVGSGTFDILSSCPLIHPSSRSPLLPHLIVPVSIGHIVRLDDKMSRVSVNFGCFPSLALKNSEPKGGKEAESDLICDPDPP